jgi:hypothetical protein
VPFESASDEHFYAVRWGRATAEDCKRIAEEVNTLSARQGRPVLYLAIMPADMPRLDNEARDALMTLTTELAEKTAMACVVMEARGFSGAAMRSVMTGIMLITRRSSVVKFVDSIAAALDESKAFHLADKSKMRKVIERVGGEPPASFR